jgi:hypothetical protein
VQLKIVPAYEGGITVGQKLLYTLYGSGPASYSQTTGDVLSLPYGIYLDSVDVCMDTTHTYLLVPYPSVVGSDRITWSFKWYTAAGMTEVAGLTNLSTFSAQFAARGGNF